MVQVGAIGRDCAAVPTTWPPNLKSRVRQSGTKVDKYLVALGWFVTFFAVVENGVHRTLWKFVGVDPTMAACIFFGARIDGAISYLKRIADATDWPKGRRELLDHIASQFGEITQLRNDLLRYGVTGESADALVITNEKFAHVKSRIRTTKISTAILNDATVDLLFSLFQLSEVAGEHASRRHLRRGSASPRCLCEPAQVARPPD